MSTTKECKEYILEKLDVIEYITCRPMMGEYLLYYKSVLFGGIYDGRLLVKKTAHNKVYALPEEIPYKGAKTMYKLDVDDQEFVCKVILDTYEDCKKK